MSNNRISKTRILGITSIVAIFVMSFATVAFAATPKVEYMINLNITCNNTAFCGGPKTTQTVQATAYSGGHQTTQIVVKQWKVGGGLAFTMYTTWTGTWKIGADGNFVTSGLNTTTFVVGTHATTITSHFSNYDTGTSATPGTLTCAQIVGTTCPKGVSASQTVVKV
ncbi:MAG: hypothetical protein ACHQ1H_00080 [Nitrososphaerales archaeon]